MHVQVKLTIPKIALNSNQVRSDIMSAMRRKTVPDSIKLFKKTTEGWRHRPSWSATYRNNPDIVKATVFPSGPHANQYAIVNFGAPPHVIRPRRAKMLHFQPGYRAATRPRILSSRSKQRFGEPVFARQVNHPGFEAREFDERVAEVMAPKFAKQMSDALKV